MSIVRPNLMAPTAFSTGKVFVMWDLQNSLIKSKHVSGLDFGALVRRFLTTHGYTGDVKIYAGYARSGGVPEPLLRELQQYVTFCFNPFNSDHGAEIVLNKQISELMAQNEGAPATFVLVSSSARYRQTLVQLSNFGFNTLVVYNPNNIPDDHLAFISNGYCCTDVEFFSLP